MPDHVNWVSDEDWKTVVSNVPIVSIDLVVLTPNGVVLGRRKNEPAKDQWFVPGGRVHKGEQLDRAAKRIARKELGVKIKICERLGVYEHLYETSEISNVGGKHYVPVGYVVSTEATSFSTDSQHADLRIFSREDLPKLHEYVEAYLLDADIIA